MLNAIDVAVIRAALQFLDEEFSPDEEELLQHYLDHDGVLAGARTEHIKATRAKLDTVELYLSLKQIDQDELVSTKLIRWQADDEISYQANKEVPVSVIFTMA